MNLWRRIIFRAGVLIDAWTHKHAFELGLMFGGSVAVALILVH